MFRILVLGLASILENVRIIKQISRLDNKFGDKQKTLFGIEKIFPKIIHSTFLIVSKGRCKEEEELLYPRVCLCLSHWVKEVETLICFPIKSETTKTLFLVLSLSDLPLFSKPQQLKIIFLLKRDLLLTFYLEPFLILPWALQFEGSSVQESSMSLTDSNILKIIWTKRS